MKKGKASKRMPTRSVNVPRPLYDAIKKIVEEGGLIQSYVSVDDFVRDVLRRRLDELKPTTK